MNNIIDQKAENYNSILKFCRQICADFSGARYEIIGRSIAGRDIPAIIIGNTEDYALYAGGFHGSERLTVLLLAHFANELCKSLRDGTPISDIRAAGLVWDKGLIIVPCVNPDGYEVARAGAKEAGAFEGRIKRLCNGNTEHWNANLRGVDINHNFDADWDDVKRAEKAHGIFGPGPTKYGGEHPMSEPETRAIAGLCKKYKIRHVLAFHSQGEVIYPPPEELRIPRAEKMAQLLSTSSGYALESPTGTAVGGGFKDWFIKEFGRPGFTVEIGKGRNPLPREQLEEIYNRLKEMLTIGMLL